MKKFLRWSDMLRFMAGYGFSERSVRRFVADGLIKKIKFSEGKRAYYAQNQLECVINKLNGEN